MEQSVENKLVFNTVDEVKQSYNTGNTQRDLEVVNAVLNGNVEIKGTGQPEQNIVLNDVQENIQPSVVDDYNQKIEEQRKYAEFLESKQREQELKYLQELQDKENKIQQEKQSREEIEKRLQELSKLNEQRLSTSSTETEQTTEEDEFVTDYAKSTRKMVEELKSQVGANPVIQELYNKINTIESEYQTQKQQSEKLQQERLRKIKEDKVFDGIRQFQMQHPELKTNRDIRELDQEYINFRKNVGYAINAKSTVDIDKAIDDYYVGGPTKEILESKGIKPFEEFDKYNNITEIIDLKSGQRYDKQTGHIVPILDEDGNRIRYRSFEEAYKISTYENAINDARKRSFQEVSKKLETINNAPVTIPPSQTDAFKTGFSLEEEKAILSWEPKDWVNNPDRARMVKEVYTKRGLEPPRYRGRKW